MDIVYAIWLRSMKRFIRSRSGIIGSALMPFFVLLFLGVGLNNVVSIPGLGGNYLVFLIPGMVTMSVMFSAIGSGVQILWDRKFGFLKVTLVAPVSRLEIMAGQTAGGATNAVLQGCCILIPALILLGL
ncbi:MAG: ABC transporter permease, partial [Methanoregula sp.]|nr:ABC transporter permease [Methanoregula sp.]